MRYAARVDNGGPRGRRVAATLAAILAIVPFLPAVGGEYVWDDTRIIGQVTRLRSASGVFSRGIFAEGSATYWRPLVTLSMLADLRIWGEHATWGLHLTNALWHGLAAWLVFRALGRWSGASVAACFAATVFWALLPAKAESVAWISGRADPMGLALVLSALEVRRLRPERVAWGAIWSGIAVLMGVLCKEAFVVVPIIVLIDLLAERASPQRTRSDVGSAAIVAGTYLFARSAFFPIRGGGAAMFAELSVAERVALVARTVADYARAQLVFLETHVLRDPIGFAAPFRLQIDTAKVVTGAGVLVGLAAVSVRFKACRLPALLWAGGLVPVLNVIPSGLESHANDRFLYVPSLGAALAVCTLAPRLLAMRPPLRHLVALGTGAILVAAAALTAYRSWLFGDADRLWSSEKGRDDVAMSVANNAAFEAARHARFDEARDDFLLAASRSRKLGFDQPLYLFQAVLAQADAPHSAPFDRAYHTFLTALVNATPMQLDVPLENGHVVNVDLGSDDARAFAAENAARLRRRLSAIEGV